MAGDESVESDYIDSLTGLSEPTNNLMFTTSETKLTIDETGLSQMGNSIAILVLVTCLLGFANGVDFMQPESGLIRPDEFVFRFANNAPDESAVFNGQVFDMNDEPIANATVRRGPAVTMICQKAIRRYSIFESNPMGWSFSDNLD